jgi:predicted RNase H-like HicB family nuclease
MTRFIALSDGKRGAYALTVPDLPGCTSAASSIDEVLSNAIEAVRPWLEDAGTVPVRDPTTTLLKTKRSKQRSHAVPDMIKKATDPTLKQGFQTHLAETENHVKRVEQVFQMHGVEASGVNCPAIDGIIEKADDVAGQVDDKAVLDAALIAAAQAVEHYEMTRYGTLVAWA